MRRRLFAALLALIGAAAVAVAFPPIPPPKKAAASLKNLDGSWKLISYTYMPPNKAPRTTVPYSKVVIKGDKWSQISTLKGKDGPEYTFKIDADKTPPTIDMEPVGKIPSGPRQGVVLLKDNRLTVTYVLKQYKRPEKADGEMQLGQYRWVLEREKP